MTRLLLTVGALLFLSLPLRAQFFFNDRCQATYQSIFRLQFLEANRLLVLEKQQNPTNLVPVLLENYIDFLTLFIGEEKTQFHQLEPNKSKRITLLEKGDKNSPYYNFFLGEVYLQWAFARIKFGEYASAAIEVRKAYSLFTLNQSRFPDFIPNNTGLGLVHVIIGIIPEKYQWIKNLMGVNGSVDQGFKEIHQVAGYQGSDPQIQLFKPEATFYLALLAANLQKNQKEALPILELLERQSSGNQLDQSPLLIFAQATILLKNGRNDQVLKILQHRNEEKNKFPFCYLDFLEGVARLNSLDVNAALCFQRYVHQFKGQNYLRSAYQKLAWISILKGDTAGFKANMGKVTTVGEALVDEDKQATREAQSGLIPGGILLRARLLFDGGYYDRALQEILNNPVKKCIVTRRDFIEYSYRLARIYHELGQYSKAIGYYKQTIQRGKTDPFYFATASALQLGLIYENLSLYKQADSSYRLSLSIPTPEYKSSLNQKAKAGLNRLKKQQR
ncbi:MAG: tetratricopeptide repeat protein [Bacteroidales bacterium]|nr:tetratricopeptide repeat protein [Bacteroidales bacterium]